MQTSRPRFDAIQSLRLVAALAVVVYHASIFSWQPALLPTYWATLNLGHVAVVVFFSISGFVIALQRKLPIWRFALHRAARIYPGFFAAFLVGTALLMFNTGGDVRQLTGAHLLLLLPFGLAPQWSGVPFWTLNFEIYFYALSCVLMIANSRFYAIGLLLWGAFLLSSFAGFPYPPSGQYGVLVFTSPYGLYFIAGACIGLNVDGVKWPLPAFLFMVGTWVLIGEMHQFVWLLVLLVLATGATMACSTFPPNQLLRRMAAPADWSYGLYLIHIPVQVILAQLLPPWSAPLRLAVMLPVSGAIGLLFGYWEFYFYRKYWRPIADRFATSIGS